MIFHKNNLFDQFQKKKKYLLIESYIRKLFLIVIIIYNSIDIFTSKNSISMFFFL